MGVGTDLMRFFAADSQHRAGGGPLPLREFHRVHQDEYRYPATTLRAARRLADAGYLVEQGAVGAPVLESSYLCLRTLSELEDLLTYGTFDFVVDGLPAVRHASEASVFLLAVVGEKDEEQGTAFAMRPNLMATARHCLQGKKAVRVVVPGRADIEVGPWGFVFDPDGDDVALLVLPADVPARCVRVREPELLEPVVTMGFPRLQCLRPALMSTTGEIAGFADAYTDGNAYGVTTCAMTGGSSGGPIIGLDGAVVGIVSALPHSPGAADSPFGLLAPAASALSRLADRADVLIRRRGD